jgi:fumarate hydratase, class I
MMNRKKTAAREAARKTGTKVSPAAKKPLAAMKPALGRPTSRQAAKHDFPKTGVAKRPARAGVKKAAVSVARKSPPRAAPKAGPKAPTKKVATRAPSPAKAAGRRALAPSKAVPQRAPAKPASPRFAPRRAAPPSQRLDPKSLRASFLEIVRRTSVDLPMDVVRAIEAGRAKEEMGSNALWAMNVITDNIGLARDNSAPLCQDTGSILFYIRAPRGFDETVITRAAAEAVSEATALGFLRQNSVDSLTGRNSGNNLGPGSPHFHIHQWGAPDMEVRLMLKGGGCENVGAQYSLPDSKLGADRNLAGVEKCLLDAAYQAQGKGCGPGILGVCVGGDRATGYAHSKEQLLRPLSDTNLVPELAALEARVTEEANRLGIGPMGFGGTTTLLGCKVGVLNRLPASFFVSISYMCWAYRRQGAVLTPDGSIRSWLY